MLELNLNATQKIFGLAYKHLKAKIKITLIKIQSYDTCSIIIVFAWATLLFFNLLSIDWKHLENIPLWNHAPQSQQSIWLLVSV